MTPDSLTPTQADGQQTDGTDGPPPADLISRIEQEMTRIEQESRSLRQQAAQKDKQVAEIRVRLAALVSNRANLPDEYVPDDIEKISNIQFTENGSPPLTLDVYRLKNASYSKPQPAIIWLHGGGWMSGDKELCVERLFASVRDGFIGVSANYRLSQAALFPAQLHDCKCAVRFLRANCKQFNVDADRIGAWGASAGGHLASLLATTGSRPELEGDRGWSGHSSSIQAACSWFGPSDLNLMDKFPPGIVPALESMNDKSAEGRLVGGAVSDKQDLVALANPIRYISSSCPPILLMHGAKDNYVPLASSTEFHQRLLDARVDSTFHVISNGHHNAYLWGDHHIKQVTEFFEWHLRKPAPTPHEPSPARPDLPNHPAATTPILSKPA